MRELTIGEKLFIDESYTELKPREMAKGLRISNELVRGYMHAQGYKSICCRNPPKPLTDKEKEDIRNNCASMNINQLSMKIGKPFNTIKRFADSENIPYKLTKSGRPKEEKVPIIHKQYVPKQPVNIIRHPAVYSNTNWEQYGQDILNR